MAGDGAKGSDVDFEVGAFREVAADDGKTEFARGGFEGAVELVDGDGGKCDGSHNIRENPRGAAAHGRDVGNSACDGLAGYEPQRRVIEKVVIPNDGVGGGEKIASRAWHSQNRAVVAGASGDVRRWWKCRRSGRRRAISPTEERERVEESRTISQTK